MKTTNESPVVATRTTFDGVSVNLHASGELSTRTHYLRGKLPVAIMWRAIDDICIHTFAELPGFIRAAKKNGKPGGGWRTFGICFNPVYKTALMANGLEVWIRVQ